MIFWDILLGTEDVKGALAKMYEEMSLAQIAEYLGVSVSAVREQCKRCRIPLRPRGGRHPNYKKGEKT